MARQSQDREDLLRDASAFVTRVQLQVEWEGGPVEVFVGFRTNGAVSFYFDQDPVYHFNSQGELRRAHVDDRLIKAERGRLVSLRRQPSEAEVAMVRQEMPRDEQQEFCQQVSRDLDGLHQAISRKAFTVDGQVAGDAKRSAMECLIVFLQRLGEIKVADSPRVGC